MKFRKSDSMAILRSSCEQDFFIPAKKLSVAEITDILTKQGLLEHQMTYGNNQRLVPQMVTDSRACEKNEGFIAYKGINQDGHAYLNAVLAQEPSLIVYQDQRAMDQALENSIPENLTLLRTSDPRLAWSIIEEARYNNPGRDLNLIGITGTNGKTSTGWYIKELMKQKGEPIGFIGTLGTFLGDLKFNTLLTTPDCHELMAIFSLTKKLKIKTIVMEVSSQALVHGRLGSTNFDYCLFTSFSRDHLDLHGGMRSYFDAKTLLFSKHSKLHARWLIHQSIKSRCASYYKLADSKKCTLEFYGDSSENEHVIKAHKTLVIGQNSGHIELHEGIPHANFLKNNLSAAMIIANSILSVSHFKFGLISEIPGRMEQVHRNPDVFVDFAHTSDGIEQVLKDKSSETLKGRLICLFGCGGDRDRTKRPLMAKAAVTHADFTYITSDNPRSEDPLRIIADALKGVGPEASYTAIVDRQEAIERALSTLEPSDTLIICGKGHEQYQIVGKQKVEFSDQNIVKKFFQL